MLRGKRMSHPTIAAHCMHHSYQSMDMGLDKLLVGSHLIRTCIVPYAPIKLKTPQGFSAADDHFRRKWALVAAAGI